VLCRLPEAGFVAGRHRKIERGLPDRGIVGPALQAPAQPCLGLLKPTAKQGQPRPPQPDAIVGFVRGVEKELPPVNWYRLDFILPKVLE
jgi:hypothetical protein